MTSIVRFGSRWGSLLLLGNLLVALGQNPAPTPPLPSAAPGSTPLFPSRRIPSASTPIARLTNLAARNVANTTVTPLHTNLNPNALKFDATSKSVDLKQGETKGLFKFALTNVEQAAVTITGIHTSCGCTAGQMPKTPWVLAPGESGVIDITMDMTGKFGKVTKTATISSSSGPFVLQVSSTAPPPDPSVMRTGDRMRNLQVAGADRQAIFRNDCATCHVHPTTGKVGKVLFDTACGICHDAEHRASMVPTLRDPKRATDANYWSKWITEGREGSLMPAFALNRGGILTTEQITSLVDYLEGDFKKEPVKPAATPTVAPAKLIPPPAGPAVK
jgi:cytochrome c5